MREPTAVEKEILVRGLDDWVMLSEVVFVVAGPQDDGPTPPQVVDRVVGEIEWLVEEGLVEVGDVAEGADFVAWDGSAEEMAQRVREGSGRLEAAPNMGDVCWLNNTSEGDKLARRLEP